MPISIKVNATEAEDYLKLVTTEMQKVPAIGNEWCEILAKAGANRMETLAPQRTGQLKSDVRAWKSDKNTWNFGIPEGAKSASYAKYPERGTRSPIRGKKGPLVFRGEIPFPGVKHVLPQVMGQTAQRFGLKARRYVDSIATKMGMKLIQDKLIKRLIK